MDMSAPHTVLLSQTEARILSALAGTNRPMAGREVARLIGMSQNGVWRTLQRLANHGLLTEQEAGGAVLYTLNRDHLAATAAVALTRLRSALIERIREELGNWEIKPTHASMFGSAARGDGDTASDIDVFIVRPADTDEEDEKWRSQINTLSDSILRWTGNHAGISEVQDSDVARLRRERPPIVEELERDAVPLLGPPASELLSRTRR